MLIPTINPNRIRRDIMGKFFFSFIFLIFLIGVCSANQVQSETSNSITTISLITEEPLQLGAFDIQLNYSVGDTTIEKIDAYDPFSILTDIDNVHGIVRIAGFAGQDPSASTTTKMVRIVHNGSEKFELLVRRVVDTNVHPISVTNPSPVLQTVSVTPVSTLQVYNLNPAPYVNHQVELPVQNVNNPVFNPDTTPILQVSTIASNPLNTVQPGLTIPVTEKISPGGTITTQQKWDTTLNQGEQIATTEQTSLVSQQKTPISIIVSAAGIITGCFIYMRRKL